MYDSWHIKCIKCMGSQRQRREKIRRIMRWKYALRLSFMVMTWDCQEVGHCVPCLLWTMQDFACWAVPGVSEV